MTYLLAIATAMLLREVAIAAAIARATVVPLRLVAQAIADIATSELGPCGLKNILNEQRPEKTCLRAFRILGLFTY